MQRLLIGLIPLALLNAGLMYGQYSSRPSTGSVQGAVANLVRRHNAWGPKGSTRNASLAIKETVRSGEVTKFRLYAAGVPKDRVYSLVSWPVTQKGPSEALAGVTLDPSGLAICAGTPGTCAGDKPKDPVNFTLRPHPGEPVRLGLVSADGAVQVFAKVVPVPLRGEDRGCTVEGVLLTPGSELVLIEGSGFPANGELTLDSDSEGERHSAAGKIGADGRYASAILPYKQGVIRGSVKVNLKATSCSPSVTVPWGRRN